jgi:hypothetical protein
MLQWNTKFSALLVVAVLVALAAVNAFGLFDVLNLTW